MLERFSKYERLGAYHWQGVAPRDLSTYNPRLLARYELTLQALKRRSDLHGRLGLDIGCGDGVLLSKMARKGAFAVGFDHDPRGLTLARERLANWSKHVLFANASCYHIPFANDSFDFVTLLEVIEHLHRPSDCLAEVWRVLKPRGVLVLTTPQRPLGQVTHSHHHVIEFTAAELHQLLLKYFCDVQVRGTHLAWMVVAYTDHRGFKPKLFRLICKLLSVIGLNPFMLTTDTPDDRWEGLLGIGYKHSQEMCRNS